MTQWESKHFGLYVVQFEQHVSLESSKEFAKQQLPRWDEQ